MATLTHRTTLWTAGTVLACLLVAALTWATLIGPRRAVAASLRDQAVGVQQQNEVLRTRIAQLRDQYAELPATRDKIAEIARQLPATADLPGVLRTVDSLATSSGVTLLSLAPGTAQAVSASAAPGSGAAAAAGSAGTAAGTGTASSGAATLVSVPLSITVTGDYFQAVAFLRALQTGSQRAILVTGLQLAQQDGSSASSAPIQLTLNSSVFVWRGAGSATAASATSAGTAGRTGAGAAATAAASPAISPGASAAATTAPAAPASPTAAASVAAAPSPEATTW